MKSIDELLGAIDALETKGEPKSQLVKSIEYDSRKVKEGALFVAIRGFKTDGHEFIERAVESGAIAIACEAFPKRLDPTRLYVRVENARVALAQLAKRFYDDASDRLTMIGVTGTNGKTTTTTLIHGVLESAGIKAGLIGTVAYKIGNETIEAERTTPESIELHSLFDKMTKAGCQACVMEVSSHALALRRVHGIRYDVAVFTNLTRDHLDFHGTMENYFRAKKTLFDSLDERAVAITNIDSPYGEQIIADSKARALTYGIEGESAKKADIRAKAHRYELSGTTATIFVKDDGRLETIRHVGKFNLYNALAAIAVGYAMNLSRDDVMRGVNRREVVAGRMEQIWSEDGRCAIVDYAHTPDALLNVIRAIKEVLSPDAKLITLFGCGGERDKGKRPLMGEIAERESDVVILTSDNPRAENPETILDEIEAGMTKRKPFYRIADREAAIRKGISLLKRGDALLVAGKGHEPYQEIQGAKHPFDDRAVVRKIFDEARETDAKRP
ncbi:MAG: UDP-N-acetylmuramoyl-L-alanyl-D-glutamate--2,6-diaminopimelate ligase [Chloroherpetonaceae bacterium]|nr:UDP-N-acetylmuramoyl-L-alanyl-D-glutamate--2,6-diaminopimelate ligase [Chloroherpetonaceae bacterium]MDW8437644.1 UDP-N-acetylmuramoyl-L-alanyl-D-glutamate--2,6-diaminopimelate ligase [Chloroherpetonaceae bacterium]